MTERTILIHRGGWGPSHKLGSIHVRPEGERNGYFRYQVNLSILGDSRRAEASVVEERLDDIIKDFTAIAGLKETYVEAGARRKREAERSAMRQKRRYSSRSYRR